MKTLKVRRLLFKIVSAFIGWNELGLMRTRPLACKLPKDWHSKDKLSILVRQIACPDVPVVIEHGSTYRDAIEKACEISRYNHLLRGENPHLDFHTVGFSERVYIEHKIPNSGMLVC